MLRRSLALAFPLMLSAVAALSWVHFRRGAEIEAAPPRQVAQADPTDPFAPPADPPAVKPVNPAPVPPPADPATRPTNQRKSRVRRETPRSDDEVRTPFLRSLLGQLDGFTDVSEEDRDGVRKMLYEADVELSESMGPAARRRIEAANRKPGFSIGSPGPRTAADRPRQRSDFERSQRRVPRDPAAPKPDPFKDDPPPADPAAPKKDVFDDL